LESRNAEDQIHVAFASDAEGVEGLAIAGFSTLERASRPVHFWVISDEIPERAQKRLLEVWQKCPRHAGTTFIPMSSLPIPMPVSWIRKKWPLTSAARFQLPLVMPSTVKRCVYLDIDVLAGTDVAELYDHDLGGHPLGMVLTPIIPDRDKEYLRSINLDPAVYCNAGVLLMDLDAWRREDAPKRIIEFGLGMGNVWFFDQDMLNAYFKGRYLLLEGKWNHRDAGIEPDGRIQHFAGSTKPWEVTAATATLAGHKAWHAAKERSGFQSVPVPAFIKLKKNVRVITAKVQRRLARSE
jgi:lipopolysaccharide biosynthesis glycosyltransferase